jgi:hypothetical protein
MKAHMEHHEHKVATIRVGGDNFRYGDPYMHHLSMGMSNPPEIVGLNFVPTPSLARAMKQLLFDHQIPKVFYTRIRPNGQRIIKYIFPKDYS